MTSTRLLTVAGAVLAAFVSMTSTSLAQTATGQITGTVRDASGAVMPGVKVAVTNEQTGLTRQTITGANGEYVIPLLPVGVYVVTGNRRGSRRRSTRRSRSRSTRSSESTCCLLPGL